MVILFRFYECGFQGLCELVKSMCLRSHICQWDLAILCQYPHLFTNICRKSSRIVSEHWLIKRCSDGLHFVEFAQATCGRPEEVELIKLSCELIALLSDCIVSQGHSCLSKLQEAFLVLELLGRIKRHLYIATSYRQVESLFQILLKEESNLRMTLLFEVANNRMTT